MGKGKNGGRPLAKMSNLELAGKLKRTAMWISKNDKATKIANDMLKEIGLSGCHLVDNSKEKAYQIGLRDKYIMELTKRGLKNKLICEAWFNAPVTAEDVMAKIDIAYYNYIDKICNNNAIMTPCSINEIDRCFQNLKSRTRKRIKTNIQQDK